MNDITFFFRPSAVKVLEWSYEIIMIYLKMFVDVHNVMFNSRSSGLFKKTSSE
jgi:hypothetical protein